MKKIIGIVFILLFSIGYCCQKAPNFNLRDLNGSYVSLNNYKGRRIVLMFWATWCPNCQNTLKEIDKFCREHESETNDIVFIGITKEDERVVNDYLQENGYEFKVLFNKDGSVYKEYAVEFVPTLYFINEKNEITGFFEGDISRERLLEEI